MLSFAGKSPIAFSWLSTAVATLDLCNKLAIELSPSASAFESSVCATSVIGEGITGVMVSIGDGFLSTTTGLTSLFSINLLTRVLIA